MNQQETIKAQALLNRYQYDHAAYLDACKDAGIDAKGATDFADEVYTQLGEDSGSRSSWSALVWMLGGLSLLFVMCLVLWLAARPMLEKIAELKP